MYIAVKIIKGETKMKMSKLFKMTQIVLFVLILSLSGNIGCKDDKNKVVDPGKTCPVTLLQTTDMHNRVAGVGPFLENSPNFNGTDSILGGFSRLATEIKNIRTAKTAAGSEVLLVDSGDYSMGTVYDFLWDTDPAPFRFIQQMGYDVVTLGNHEFDYGPAKLAVMIKASQDATGGFTVPIVASNTVFDTTSAADDTLEALETGVDPAILTTYTKTLPNGLIIGFIGLMGKSASDDSPNAGPVTFKYDYTNAAVKTYIQGIVDDLRNTQGANVIIALSHSGVTPISDPGKGNDIDLAENITGIDIIASGHDHEMTSDNEIIEVTNTTTGHVTHIFCAGAYTTNLAELSFTATEKIGVTGLTLANHTIDDTLAGDVDMNTTIAAMNTVLNARTDIPDITEVMGTMDSSFSLNEPSAVVENGLGELIADAVRYAGTATNTFTIGAFATGVIRDDFVAGESITFADIFAMVPLGITTATDQGTYPVPGYPLLKVYLKGTEIWDMCKFDALIMGFPSFAQDFVHLSGIQYTVTSGAVTSVKSFAWDDFKCTGTATDLAQDTTLYPCIIDSYVMAMLLSPGIQGILGVFNINIHPKLSDGTTLVDATNMSSTTGSVRLDKDSGTSGVQEFYAWSALNDYFSTLPSKTIPADPYKLAAYPSHNRIIIVP